MCARMYTAAPTGKSREQLYALLFNKEDRGSQKNLYEEKKHTADQLTKRSRHGGSNAKRGCCITKVNVSHWSRTLKSFLHALRGKEEDAPSEVEAYMEYCAKRWQTREGTYQLKRRRLLPDVRDPPEQGNAEVDMKDI